MSNQHPAIEHTPQARNRDALLAVCDTFAKEYLRAISFTDCHCDNPELQNAEFSPELITKAQAECAKFQAENEAALVDYPTDAAAHDFWFSRNGHGCGFWENDYSTPEHCAVLHKAAKVFGEVYVYAGDDGLIYCN